MSDTILTVSKHRIAIKLVERKKESKGGILLPFHDDRGPILVEAEVVSSGSKEYTVRDRVILPRPYLSLDVNDETLFIVREIEILAKVSEKGENDGS